MVANMGCSFVPCRTGSPNEPSAALRPGVTIEEERTKPSTPSKTTNALAQSSCDFRGPSASGTRTTAMGGCLQGRAPKVSSGAMPVAPRIPTCLDDKSGRSARQGFLGASTVTWGSSVPTMREPLLRARGSNGNGGRSPSGSARAPTSSCA